MEITNQNKVKVKGKLLRKIFPKGFSDDGYSVYSIRVTKVLKGEMASNSMFINVGGEFGGGLDSNVEYTILFERQPEKKYKDGFRRNLLSIHQEIGDNDIVAQKDFLRAILTEKQVESLYRDCNNVWQSLKSENIDDIIKAEGIGETRANRILEKFNNNLDNSYAIGKLSKLGITDKTVKKIINYYDKNGNKAVNAVYQNPFTLIGKISNFGFFDADKIGYELGIDSYNPKRISAYTNHSFKELANKGYSWVDSCDFVENCVYSLSNDVGDDEGIRKVIIKDINKKIDKGEVKNFEKGKIGLNSIYKLEEDIIKEVFRLMNADEYCLEVEDCNEVLKQVEGEQGWEFTEEQKEGIRFILNNPFCLIIGSAGTGKTSILLGALRCLNYLSFNQCALSGKASARIQEATGMDASTIHRMLGFDFNNPTGFKYNKSNQLTTDVVVLDEFSMVGGKLFKSVLEALMTGTRLILLGDKKQLPSIGYLNLITDMIDNKYIPTFELTKPHRQAYDSYVFKSSMDINEGVDFIKDFRGQELRGKLQDLDLTVVDLSENMVQLITDKFIEYYKESKGNIEEVQVIVPLKERGDCSCYNLNLEIQEMINPFDSRVQEVYLDGSKPYALRIGDKIMNVKNNYNLSDIEGCTVEIFNGYTGILRNVCGTDLYIEFPNTKGINNLVVVPSSHWQKERAIVLGYASTTHKVQGSGYLYPIIAYENSHYQMLNRENIYTALTRAKKGGKCALIVQYRAFLTAINTSAVKDKQTYFHLIVDNLINNKKEIKE